MKELRFTEKLNNNRISSFLFTLLFIVLFLVFTETGFAQEKELANLERILQQNRYSSFQQRMIITTTQELLKLQVDHAELNKLLSTSIANRFDAYNIKKILEVIIDAKKNGLSEKSLLNKFKEGLAKRVDERLIVEVLLKEAENLKIVKNMLKGNFIAEVSFEQDIIVDSLMEGLNNGVPQDSLSEVITRGAREGKRLQEVAEVSAEMGNLSLKAYELGLSEQEVNEVFSKAVASRSGIDGICEDIQDTLIAAAVAKMNLATRNSSGSSSQSTSITGISEGEGSTPGSSSSSIIPSSSSTSTPTASDDKPDTGSTSDSGSSSPPEN